MNSLSYAVLPVRTVQAPQQDSKDEKSFLDREGKELPYAE